jgi:hypothetical protein
MILDKIQGCRYLRRSTDRWLLLKNSTTRLEGLESWHGAGLLWNCSIPITNTKGYIYTLVLTWLLVDHDYNIYYLKSTPWCHVRLVSTINLSSIHVITHSRMLPLPSVEQLSYRMTMYSWSKTPLPNALSKTSCRMVFFCQIRLTCQSLPCTNFWC